MKLGLTELQIAERRQGIGGSDAGAIVAGGEEWLKLWKIKTGRAKAEDLSNILAVVMGQFTEPLNCHWYEKQTGRKVTRRGERVQHPTIPYIVANLDGESTTASAERCYLDFKHLGRSGDQATIRYTAQGTHCSSIIGAEWWAISCFIGSSKWELTEQEADPFFQAEYLERCREFWSYVESDREPPDTAGLAVPAPRSPLRIVQLDESFRGGWPNWGPGMAEELGAWATTLAGYTAHNIATGHIKELLPEDVGLVTRGKIKVARDKAGSVRISLQKGERHAC